MWLGNATKDALCLPRPRALSARVRVITHTVDGRDNAEEYGLPSTHVANCLTFFAFALANAPQPLRSSPYAWAALAAWTLLVALGRLYLGMHTPVDLAAGACVGAAALAIWWPLHEAWEAWLLAAGAWRVAAVHAGGVLLMACCYPRPPALTPSFSFVTFFSGVTAGVAVGSARGAGLAASALPAAPAAAAAMLAARAAVGVPLMLVARLLFRAAADMAWPAVAAARAAVLAAVRGLPPLPRPKSPKCVEKPSPSSALFDARYLFLRFWGYAALGWALVDPGMLALHACGLL
jgi:sphingosine-1-phosphate phosphatase 1